MKTTLYSLLTCAFILSTFAAKAKAIPIPQSDGLGPKITIIIEIGRKSKGCARFGFCDITFSLDYRSAPAPNGENTATGSAWMENGKLKIEFDRASMTNATYQTHFGSGYFQLEEDYVLPSDLAQALGVKSYTVKTGKYAVPQSTSENSTVPVTF
ncbi:MAG: hypothetical protein H7246_01570 [Phycisphaerae bacterium]|nr:hypothetical protein [Saprospiraceae bacterium]